jgi:hypothetical protein
MKHIQILSLISLDPDGTSTDGSSPAAYNSSALVSSDSAFMTELNQPGIDIETKLTQ